MCAFCGSHPCECVERAEQSVHNVVLGARAGDLARFQTGTRVQKDLERRFTPSEWAQIWGRVLAELA